MVDLGDPAEGGAHDSLAIVPFVPSSAPPAPAGDWAELPDLSVLMGDDNDEDDDAKEDGHAAGDDWQLLRDAMWAAPHDPGHHAIARKAKTKQPARVHQAFCGSGPT